MSDFFVSTSLLSFLKWIGHLFAFLGLLGIIVEIICGPSQYVFITDCDPSCTTTYPFGNYRPANTVSVISSLLVVMQKKALLLRLDYIVIWSDILRILYICMWFFMISFVREPGIFLFNSVALVFFFVIEAVKIIIYSIARIDPGSYWYVSHPNPISAIPSTQFLFIFWSCIIAIIYIGGQFILSLAISLLARKAKKEENESGNAPIRIIESSIQSPVEKPKRGKSKKIRRRKKEKVSDDVFKRIYSMKKKYGETKQNL